MAWVVTQEREFKLLDKGNKAPLRLRNLTLRHAVGNPSSRRQLLSLQEVSDGTRGDGRLIGEPTGRRVVLSYFTSILILSECAKGDFERDVEASDSRSLATTLGIQVFSNWKGNIKVGIKSWGIGKMKWSGRH